MENFASKRFLILPTLFQLFLYACANNSLTMKEDNESKIFIEPRIFRGAIAIKHEFPSIVLILASKIMCGGTIIHPEWVITAAHCLNAVTDPSKIILTAGAHDHLDHKEIKYRQTRRAHRFIIHPKNKRSPIQNDIALIQLQKPFTVNIHVNFSNLPPKNGEIDYARKSVVAGWGRYDNVNTSPSNVLRKVELPLVENKSCTRMWAPSVKILPSMVCSGGKGADACSGDSGGPLFCNIQGRQGRFLCGIVSVGTKICGTKFPGIYTRVTSYTRWIEKVIRTNT